jgi:hypothetical protein
LTGKRFEVSGLLREIDLYSSDWMYGCKALPDPAWGGTACLHVLIASLKTCSSRPEVNGCIKYSSMALHLNAAHSIDT